MICIEVALKAEAAPLIDFLKLKPLSDTSLFPIWENDFFKLIVSGVGKIKAGAACSYLAGIYRDEDIYGWLNVGIGGHQSHPIGKPLLIHKIIDEGRQNTFFPSFVFTPPCDTDLCRTVERPEHHYPKQCVYDMEAAGFYAIASKLSSLEMIHVLKIISDNHHHPAQNIDKKQVGKLIEQHAELIQTLLSEMQVLIKEMAPVDIPFLDECLKRWHFTTCEMHQLKTLLHRWQLLCPDHVLFSHELASQNSAKNVLEFLDTHLRTLPLPLS